MALPSTDGINAVVTSNVQLHERNVRQSTADTTFFLVGVALRNYIDNKLWQQLVQDGLVQRHRILSFTCKGV